MCRPCHSLVYTVALFTDQVSHQRGEKQGAADRGVWALKASGYTIDFCFAFLCLLLYSKTNMDPEDRSFVRRKDEERTSFFPNSRSRMVYARVW